MTRTYRWNLGIEPPTSLRRGWFDSQANVFAQPAKTWVSKGNNGFLGSNPGPSWTNTPYWPCTSKKKKEKLLLLKTVEWCWSPVASTHELARIDTLVLGALVTAAPPTTCHGSDLQRHLRWDLSPAGVVAARFREGWSTSPSGQTSCGWTSMIYPSETLA